MKPSHAYSKAYILLTFDTLITKQIQNNHGYEGYYSTKVPHLLPLE